MAARSPKAHVLAVPLPAQGHLNPLMRLCKQLASHDILVTFVTLGAIQDRLQQTHNTSSAPKEVDSDQDAAHSNIRRASIPFPTLDLTADFNITFETTMRPLEDIGGTLEQLIQRLSLKGPPITCIISDVFVSSATQAVADKLHIPRVALFPSSQSFNLFFHYVVEGSLSLDAGKHTADITYMAQPRYANLR